MRAGGRARLPPTLRPLWTPTRVGWTYSGQAVSMNVEKQVKASSCVGMVYRKGAERTFMPTGCGQYSSMMVEW